MADITPVYELIASKEKVIVETGSFGERVGGLSASSTSISRGSGDDIFKVTSQGVYLGAADFANAPFRITMAGAVTIGGLHIIGFTSSASTPSLTEYPTDKDAGIHKNTADGKIYLAFNSSGTIKKIELT